MQTPPSVVVGSGAAGLSAALAAAEAGARLGRRPAASSWSSGQRKAEHGGNTRWSPSYMRMAAPDRVAPGFEEDLQAASGGRIDPTYIRRLAADAPATIAWLQRHGVAFDQPVYYLSAGPPRIQPVGGGGAVLASAGAGGAPCGRRHPLRVAAERLVAAATAPSRASRCARAKRAPRPSQPAPWCWRAADLPATARCWRSTWARRGNPRSRSRPEPPSTPATASAWRSPPARERRRLERHARRAGRSAQPQVRARGPGLSLRHRRRSDRPAVLR